MDLSPGRRAEELPPQKTRNQWLGLKSMFEQCHPKSVARYTMYAAERRCFLDLPVDHTPSVRQLSLLDSSGPRGVAGPGISAIHDITWVTAQSAAICRDLTEKVGGTGLGAKS